MGGAVRKIGVMPVAQGGEIADALRTVDTRSIVVHPCHDDEHMRGKGEHIAVKPCKEIGSRVAASAEIFHRHGAVGLPVI